MTKIFSLFRKISGTLVAAFLVATVGATGAWAWSQSGDFTVGGKVGIGTESPEETMEIRNNKPVLSIHEPGVATFKIGSDGGAFKIAAMDNGYGGHTGNFDANDTQILSMSTSGKVGIGTTSPSQKLDVVGNSSGNDGITVSNPGSGNPQIRWLNDTGVQKYAITSFDHDGSYTVAHWVAGAGNTLNITQNGNVGIGTTSPTEKFEVSGNMKISGDIKTTGDICTGRCAQ